MKLFRHYAFSSLGTLLFRVTQFENTILDGGLVRSASLQNYALGLFTK